MRAIVGQQLSVNAGAAIYGRLTARFGGQPPTPAGDPGRRPRRAARGRGIVAREGGLLRSLAEHVLSGELELDRLDQLSDEEVMAELVAVKGIGEWSAHMFLMFQLDRPDVMASETSASAGRSNAPTASKSCPTRPTMERIAEPWRPHRTLACRYLWRSLNNEPA